LTMGGNAHSWRRRLRCDQRGPDCFRVCCVWRDWRGRHLGHVRRCLWLTAWPARASAAATFSFTTTAGGALAAGSTITLTYPSGFFASAGSPSVQISGSGATGSVATPTGTQIVITTAGQAIDASSAVTVTVTGLTMGGNAHSWRRRLRCDQRGPDCFRVCCVWRDWRGRHLCRVRRCLVADRVAGKTGFSCCHVLFYDHCGRRACGGQQHHADVPVGLFLQRGIAQRADQRRRCNGLRCDADRHANRHHDRGSSDCCQHCCDGHCDGLDHGRQRPQLEAASPLRPAWTRLLPRLLRLA
jgi:hypothetical protein